MDDAVALAAAAARVEIAPATGGAIASFTFDGQHVLRPTPPASDDVRGHACWPLVPYSNRIADARFTFAGRACALAQEFRRPLRIRSTAWAGSGRGPWPFATRHVRALSSTTAPTATRPCARGRGRFGRRNRSRFAPRAGCRAHDQAHARQRGTGAVSVRARLPPVLRPDAGDPARVPRGRRLVDRRDAAADEARACATRKDRSSGARRSAPQRSTTCSPSGTGARPCATRVGAST